MCFQDLSPWSLIAVRTDDALQLCTTEQAVGLAVARVGRSWDLYSHRPQWRRRAGSGVLVLSQHGSAAASLPVPFIPSPCFLVRLCLLQAVWLADRGVLQHNVALGGDIFLAWILDSGQGDAFSEQICSGSCISQFAVSFIAFSAYGCLRCSSFDLHLHTFKSSHIPVFLKLVLAIVSNHFCSALTPMLAISSKDLAAQGNCRCVLETVCGRERMFVKTSASWSLLRSRG